MDDQNKLKQNMENSTEQTSEHSSIQNTFPCGRQRMDNNPFIIQRLNQAQSQHSCQEHNMEQNLNTDTDYIQEVNLDQNYRKKEIKRKIRKMVYSQSFQITMLLLTVVAIFLFIIIGGSVVLFRKYTITLDLADGSEPMTETYTLSSGQIALGMPSRDGLHFVGWTGSNGDTPQVSVIVGNGQLGDLTYTANWSDDLSVTCQDWLVDKDNKRIKDITGEVDEFLKNGGSAKNYTAPARTIQVKPGTTVNATRWGDDNSYKVYSDQYIYVGSSGDVTVNSDNVTVYRYFYPVFDVNYSINGQSVASLEIPNSDIAFFDLYVDGNLKSSDIFDFCYAVPYGSEYKVVFKNVNPLYAQVDTASCSGTMIDSSLNLNFDFESRSGDVEVTCEDWLIDVDGNMVKEITSEVDKYLSGGNSKKQYPVLDRTALFEKGEEVSASLWGKDTSLGAYSNNYVYVSSSRITVEEGNATVYRYFYPVLDINGFIDGNNTGNTNNIARYNVYINDRLVKENVTDFYQGVPCGAKYRIEITEYIDWSYIHEAVNTDSGTMGTFNRQLKIKFTKREGDCNVVIEDWVVDKDNNRVKEITDLVDSFLIAGSSSQSYVMQSRIIKTDLGDTIDPAMFGNDIRPRSYEDDYVYAGASEVVTVEGDTTVIYRYFYPILDVNAIIDESTDSLGNTNGVALINVYINGKCKQYRKTDFFDGVPYGSEYEIKVVETQDGYEAVEEVYSGVMEDEATSVILEFDTAS